MNNAHLRHQNLITSEQNPETLKKLCSFYDSLAIHQKGTEHKYAWFVHKNIFIIISSFKNEFFNFWKMPN